MVDALARTLAGYSPTALGLAKEAAATAPDMEYGAALRYLRELITLVALSDDAREGIAAFFEKRPPALHRALAITPAGRGGPRALRHLRGGAPHRVGARVGVLALRARAPATRRLRSIPRLPVLRCPGYQPGSPEV